MQYTIVGLGEILWDMLPSGKALGGAPANFAYHSQEFGGSLDRKSTRLNSSHKPSSYAVFCLKKKTEIK